MGATSITTRSRDSIFNDLLKDLFKEGNSHILFRNFALGKDWNVAKTQYLFQYLSLLGNFSCDIEGYFNCKLKESLMIDVDVTLTTEAIITSDALHSLTIKKTDSATLVEWFIKSLDNPTYVTDQDNISNTIYVNDDDLIPYTTGTLEDKIVAYVNSLGYVVEDINSTVWVDYIGGSEKP
jgi:hypothetical protein